MMTWHTKPLNLRPAILAIALLAAAPSAMAQDADDQTLTVILAFHDGTGNSVKLTSGSFTLATIAGKLTLQRNDILDITVQDRDGRAIMALRNGERWSGDAGDIVTAVFGKEATDAFASENRVLRSVSFTGPGERQAPSSHCYKVLFKDNSTAIIDPSAVSWPVRLESGNAAIPLGAVGAMKFAIPENKEIPESVFVRLKSGHVYQFPWGPGGTRFSAESISGNTLTIAYATILGILPVAGGITSDTGSVPDHVLRLEHADNTVTTAPAPLQIWSFMTGFGRVTLPSTLVSSFSIPRKWRGQAEIQTLYGERFTGRPDFKTVFITTNGQTETVHFKSLDRVSRPTSSTPPGLPSASAVFYLADGYIITGVPYAAHTLIEALDGEPILPGERGSISRTKSDAFMYAPSRGTPTFCRPAARKIEICLTTTGQKAKLDWDRIVKIEFNQPVQSVPPPLPDTMAASPDTQPPPPMTEPLPIAEPRQPDEPLPTEATTRIPDDDLTPVDTRAGTAKTSWFGWFRGRSGSPSTGDPASTLSLQMPWGQIDVQTNQIKGIHLQGQGHPAALTTTSGDVIVTGTSILRKGGLPDTMPDRVFKTDSAFTFALPETVQRAGNVVRIRLMRGDILTGTFAGNDIPFAAADKSDPRTMVQADQLRKIIRTGEDTLVYDTDRGILIGKPVRDKIRFNPAASLEPAEIPIREIEAAVVGNVPLPPPITHTPGRPPALCGLVYLPGGTFVQGGGETGMTDETPKINVTLSPFFLDATEVTRAQFAVFIRDSRYRTTAVQARGATTWENPGFLQQPDDPVVCVSWADAAEFCNWRSRQSSLQPVYTMHRDGSITTDRTADGYRLPTESEWEFAAGGMRKTTYPWGNSLSVSLATPQPANFMQRDGERDDGWRWTNPVNAFPPDPNGIYGMAGNVWEWCEDWYFNKAYDALKNRSPLNPCIQQADAPGLTHRVMRGGSYRNTPDLLRTASRGSGLPHAYAPHVGFRCARNAN